MSPCKLILNVLEYAIESIGINKSFLVGGGGWKTNFNVMLQAQFDWPFGLDWTGLVWDWAWAWARQYSDYVLKFDQSPNQIFLEFQLKSEVANRK